MNQEPFVISNSLFQELHDIWENTEEYGRRIGAIISRIRVVYGIEQSCGWESLLLYGRQKDRKMVEHCIGELIAIAPGIVILRADMDSLPELSGLLLRSNPEHSSLFHVKVFSDRIPDTLLIYPSRYPNRRRYKLCPVWIHWGLGAGMVASDDCLGIDPGRWKVLKRWLDKWLPKSS